MSENLTPEKILETGLSFLPSKILLTAVEFEIFTTLGANSMTGVELAEKTGIHERGIYDFFDALVALGFLQRKGDGAISRYRNSVESEKFLDKNRPEYVGGFLEMASVRLFRSWGDLGEALKTGKPQSEIKHSQKSHFEELYSDIPRLEQFMNAMAGISMGNFIAFAKKFDFSNCKTLCDVGGATGLLSSLVAQEHKDIECTTFDLPAVEPIAKKFLQKQGVTERVKVDSGDFFKDPLPKADVITMGMILHDWNLENKMHLIKSAYEALPEGGAFVAIESIIDDARRENAYGLMMSLNMLVMLGDAFNFSFADFKGWCQEVGFKKFDKLHLIGPYSAVVAYK